MSLRLAIIAGGLLNILNPLQVFADQKEQSVKLRNFQPGYYSSVSGDQEDCEDMKFDYYPTTKNTIILGPNHILSIVPGKESVESDLPFQVGCVYESEDLVEIKGKKSILTYHEWLRCKGVVRSELIKIATITNRTVTLSVQNSSNEDDDDASYDFTCVWQREDSKTK